MQDLDLERLKKSETFPHPTGYKLLVAMPTLEEKTEGGVFIPDSLQQAESTASVGGWVIQMGDLAYQDEDKFPKRPVLQRRRLGNFPLLFWLQGLRWEAKTKSSSLINDDTVEAVVADPRGVKRA